MSAVRAFIGLGSNLDDPPRQLGLALDRIAELPGTRLVATSGLWRTPPWGVIEQPAFVNAVAGIDTGLAPRALLDALLAIERALGRVRDGERWGPRRIDLDLLVYGDQRVDEEGLVVPHPRLRERAFVLVPLAEVAPSVEVPGQGRVDALLAGVDASACTRLDIAAPVQGTLR